MVQKAEWMRFVSCFYRHNELVRKQTNPESALLHVQLQAMDAQMKELAVMYAKKKLSALVYQNGCALSDTCPDRNATSDSRCHLHRSPADEGSSTKTGRTANSLVQLNSLRRQRHIASRSMISDTVGALRYFKTCSM